MGTKKRDIDIHNQTMALIQHGLHYCQFVWRVLTLGSGRHRARVNILAIFYVVRKIGTQSFKTIYD